MTNPDIIADLDAAVRAGIAMYNSGYYHAAHDAWEEYWLDLERGVPDEQFLHGLIQYTAVAHHLHSRNLEGAVGLAASAIEYFSGLSDPYRGVEIAPLIESLSRVNGDGDVTELRSIHYEQVAIELNDLDPPATYIVASVLADSQADWSMEVIDFAIALARNGAEDHRFSSLLTDFVRNRDQRAFVYELLVRHVERERATMEGVSHLFDASQE